MFRTIEGDDPLPLTGLSVTEPQVPQNDPSPKIPRICSRCSSTSTDRSTSPCSCTSASDTTNTSYSIRAALQYYSRRRSSPSSRCHRHHDYYSSRRSSRDRSNSHTKRHVKSSKRSSPTSRRSHKRDTSRCRSARTTSHTHRYSRHGTRRRSSRSRSQRHSSSNQRKSSSRYRSSRRRSSRHRCKSGSSWTSDSCRWSVDRRRHSESSRCQSRGGSKDKGRRRRRNRPEYRRFTGREQVYLPFPSYEEAKRKKLRRQEIMMRKHLGQRQHQQQKHLGQRQHRQQKRQPKGQSLEQDSSASQDSSTTPFSRSYFHAPQPSMQPLTQQPLMQPSMQPSMQPFFARHDPFGITITPSSILPSAEHEARKQAVSAHNYQLLMDQPSKVVCQNCHFTVITTVEEPLEEKHAKRKRRKRNLYDKVCIGMTFLQST